MIYEFWFIVCPGVVVKSKPIAIERSIEIELDQPIERGLV